jgi:hypothetical protein
VPLAAQPRVQLLDAGNNPVPTAGVLVTAFTTNTAGSVSNGSATTNASGIATFTALTISGFVGNYPLQFNSSNLTPLTGANVALSAGAPASVTILTQPPANATDGVNFPAISAPVVRVTDGFNNLVGQQVVASIQTSPGGSPTLGGTLTQNTSGSGQATFSGLRITGLVGAYRLRFTAGTVGATSSTIVLNVGSATNIAVNSGAGQSATIGEPVPIAPTALVTDVGGNPVSGAIVRFVTSPSGSQIQDGNTCCNNLNVTTNSSGVARLISWTLANVLQRDTITATLQITAAPFVRVIADGVAHNGLILSTATGYQFPSTQTSGQPFNPAPQIQLRSPSGGPVATPNVPITAFLVSANGTLTGAPVTVLTNSSGIATFPGLTITASPGIVQLRFGSPGYTGFQVNPIMQ